MAEWLRAWPGWAAGALSTDEIDRVCEAASILSDLERGVGFWRDESMALIRRLTETKAQLGNAVGAIIDSGGYCEGPHDVAAAIYRLTAERDELRTTLDAIDDPICDLISGQDTWAGHTDPESIRRRVVYAATSILERLRATGGAPGVSETHTDPGIVVLPDGRIVRPYRGPWPTHTDPKEEQQ
jgi:hypothetical protein